MTKAQTAEWMRRRMADAGRDCWKAGDACQPFTFGDDLNERVTIERRDGDIVFLSNGQSGHVSRLRK